MGIRYRDSSGYPLRRLLDVPQRVPPQLGVLHGDLRPWCPAPGTPRRKLRLGYGRQRPNNAALRRRRSDCEDRHRSLMVLGWGMVIAGVTPGMTGAAQVSHFRLRSRRAAHTPTGEHGGAGGRCRRTLTIMTVRVSGVLQQSVWASVVSDDARRFAVGCSGLVSPKTF